MGRMSFDSWITELDDGVIQGEYGFEPGEFTVYPESWRPMWREGLTPAAAYRRALDGFTAQREEDEAARLANWERIKAADAVSTSTPDQEREG